MVKPMTRDITQHDLIDYDEPCQICRGRGYIQHWEWSVYAQQDTLQDFPCNLCRGHGRKTVRIWDGKHT